MTRIILHNCGLLQLTYEKIDIGLLLHFLIHLLKVI